MTSAITFGAGFGPLVGGYLTHLLGWKILFGLSLFSVIGLPLLWRFTPKEISTEGHIDIVGAFLSILTALFLLLSVQIHLSFLVLSVIFGLLMVWHSKRSEDPFFRIELFRNIPYSMSALMIFMVNLCHIAAYFVLPLMLMHVNGLNEAWAGLIIFPGAILSALVGGRIGNMTDRFGPSIMVHWATLIMAAVFLLISTVVGHSYIWVMFAIFFEYVSYSINQVAISSFASKSLKMEEVGVGMGMLNLLLYVGMAIGTAIFGRVLTLDMRKWNLFSDSPFYSYSNAFLILSILILTVLVLSAIAKRASRKKKQVDA